MRFSGQIFRIKNFFSLISALKSLFFSKNQSCLCSGFCSEQEQGRTRHMSCSKSCSEQDKLEFKKTEFSEHAQNMKRVLEHEMCSGTWEIRFFSRKILHLSVFMKIYGFQIEFFFVKKPIFRWFFIKKPHVLSLFWVILKNLRTRTEQDMALVLSCSRTCSEQDFKQLWFYDISGRWQKFMENFWNFFVNFL